MFIYIDEDAAMNSLVAGGKITYCLPVDVTTGIGLLATIGGKAALLV